MCIGWVGGGGVCVSLFGGVCVRVFGGVCVFHVFVVRFFWGVGGGGGGCTCVRAYMRVCVSE